MTGRGSPRLMVPAVMLALLISLTGCGNLGAHPGAGPVGSGGPSNATTSPPAASGSGSDSATLDGISRDLDSIDSANTEAGSNSGAADEAAASGDEP